MIKIIFTHIFSEINRERGDGLTQKESGAVELESGAVEGELMNGRRSEEVRGGGFLSWGRRWIGRGAVREGRGF